MRIKVDNLTFSYANKNILNSLSFVVDSGMFLTVVGKNGSGKSTFLKCLLKINAVANGMISIDDIDINQIKRFHNIGYVPQKSDFNQEFPITVKELLKCFYNGKKNDEFYKSIINSLELNKFYNENINNLSGGQLQRVFIARALLTHPKMLILDEPNIGVDVESINKLQDILKKMKEEKVTIVLVTHDTHFCEDLSDLTLSLNTNTEYTLKASKRKKI